MRRVLFLLFIAILLAPPAGADEIERPPGSVFAAFTLGLGWAKASVDEDRGNVAETDPQLGPMWGFRIGTALNEIATLGVDYVGYASATTLASGCCCCYLTKRPK